MNWTFLRGGSIDRSVGKRREEGKGSLESTAVGWLSMMYVYNECFLRRQKVGAEIRGLCHLLRRAV